jgi:ligand-binding sensor domain-containing protein/two-component sensor histidine kinase
MKRSIFLFLLYSYTFLQGQAPERYRFINFGAKDGLTDKYVYDAVQDAYGYMWFATATGLYRYDGHRFKKISSTVDQPGRTINNTLQGIAKDQSNHLWLGSINTLQWFNPASNQFWTPDFKHKTVALMIGGLIQGIVPAQQNGMWVCTNTNYFFRFNRRDSSFIHFNSYPSGATKSVINVIDNGQEIYAVHAEGLYRFTPSGRFLGSYLLPFKSITNAFFDHKLNRILLTTELKGLYSFELKSKKIEEFYSEAPFNKHIIFSINTVPGGGYLLGAYPLHYFNPSTKRFFTFAQSKEDHQLHVTKIVKIVYDREQNAWLCSHSGLAMIPFQNAQIETILLQDKTTGNMSIEPEQVFASPGGKDLLITNTTSQGLLVYNLDTKTLQTVVNPVNTARKRIFGLITTRDSTIFLSDRRNVFKYHPKEKKMTIFPLNDQNGKPVQDVSRNVCDQDGRIYITSLDHGFYIWDYPAKMLTHVNKRDIDRVNANDNVLSPCLIDSQNQCWFTSSNGVYRYDKKANRYTLLNGAGHPQVPLMGTTFDVAEDQRGHIWIVTQASGIYEWYEENGAAHLKNYTTNNFIGLPSDYCWRIMQSPLDSTLWVSNVAGLLRIDPIGKKVLSIFSSQNGFLENDGGYNFNIVNNGLLSQLFFGRLHLLDLKHYRFNPHQPKVQLQSFKAMEKELLPISEPHKGIKLNSDENFLQFEFAALVFANSNRNQYAWMMEGIDEKWVYGGNENKVSYASLKPGCYVFKVKAANNDGLWGKVTSYRIKIRPPFYASAWFIALCLGGLGAGLWFWNRSRVFQARKEEQLKASFQQQIAESEMKALRAQMNPHFIFNSLNSIQKYILKNEHFEASQYLTKFSRLIRLILDHSNQNNILLSSELDLLKLYVEMESLRFDDKFDYHFQVDPQLNTETCEIPSMLIQPYVENAIWHGLLHKAEKGTLKLYFLKKEENWLEVTIEDDGIGRAKAAELRSKQILPKKSYGMQITENRIAVINRTQNINATCTITDLKDDKGSAAGTKVSLHFPLKPLEYA